MPRGAHEREQVTGDAVVIIPACAGGTYWTPSATCSRRDHPRIRGEHLGPEVEVAYGTGSSPRARGAPGGKDR